MFGKFRRANYFVWNHQCICSRCDVQLLLLDNFETRVQKSMVEKILNTIATGNVFFVNITCCKNDWNSRCFYCI
jgi:hypothetical protein